MVGSYFQNTVYFGLFFFFLAMFCKIETHTWWVLNTSLTTSSFLQQQLDNFGLNDFLTDSMVYQVLVCIPSVVCVCLSSGCVWPFCLTACAEPTLSQRNSRTSSQKHFIKRYKSMQLLMLIRSSEWRCLTAHVCVQAQYVMARLVPETRALMSDEDESEAYTDVSDLTGRVKDSAVALWRNTQIRSLRKQPQYQVLSQPHAIRWPQCVDGWVILSLFHQLSFSEWLSAELQVHRSRDALTDPERYSSAHPQHTHIRDTLLTTLL